ncbi:MAG: DNA primase [Moorea sp. SIO2B7]|nr:DNA primase [Moorena sp. SIO2B7]
MDIPRLHQNTIEEVKQRVDIVDVISEYVVLRKRGKDYQGLCPFHEEKTPSFSVSPSKQLYYCFGCSAGGNVFKFLMELGKQSFSQVVLDLAQRHQVPIKTLEPQERQELQRQLSLREQLYEILALTGSFYQHALRQPQGAIALNYLKSQRQLSEETIQQFQLGYAPGGWETLYRYLVEQKRYPLTLVEEVGLIKKRKSGDGYYDQFRDRLMIPIHDTQGRIIAFGSRTLADEQPKYLNSPETTLFHKSKTLFALDKARNSIVTEDRAVVVEGYFDAIALHAAGITNVVACLGTAFTQTQIKQLLRYSESKQIVVNFDADSAGSKATQRTIGEIENLVYSGQVQLRILNLPDGKDADEFLKSTPDAPQIYRNSLLNAPLWIDWQIEQLLLGGDLKQADQFQQVAQTIVKLINKIDSNELRTYYIGHCADLLSQGNSRLLSLHAEKLQSQLKIPQLRSQVKKSKSETIDFSIGSERSILEQAEADLLRIYLHFPEYRQIIIDSLEEKDLLFSLSHHRFLWQQIVNLEEENPQLQKETSNRLLSLLQDHFLNFPKEMSQLAHLFNVNEKIEWEDILRIPLVIKAASVCLEWVACEKYRRYCLQQWQKLHPGKESKSMQYYYQELHNLKQRIEKLELMRNLEILDIVVNC